MIKLKISRKGQKIFRLTIVYTGITLIAGSIVMPFIWMALGSFKPEADMFTKIPEFLPRNFTVGNYKYIIWETLFLRHMLNSFVVASTTTFLSVLVTSLAAYALSRFRFRGSKIVSVGMLCSQMIPGVLLVIPLFIFFKYLKLLNTRLSVIIAYTTFTLPFCTWMLKGYFDSIPRELEDAAMVDGCNRLQAMTRIVLPLAAPGIAAVALFAFLLAWEEFLFAVTFLKDSKIHTLPVGLSFLVSPYLGYVFWGPVMAQSVALTLPAVIFFVYLQKYLITGLTAGAVKG